MTPQEARDRSRSLRRDLTETEQFVWQKLRGRRFEHIKFRRQVVIGNYIVDFVSFEHRLILELDGGQHAEQAQYDAERTAWLESQGFRVLRFWNHEALTDWEMVEEAIWQMMQKSKPLPPHPA